MRQSETEQTINLDGPFTAFFVVINGRRFRVDRWMFEDEPYLQFTPRAYDHERAYYGFPRRISMDIRYDPEPPAPEPTIPDSIVLGEN